MLDPQEHRARTGLWLPPLQRRFKHKPKKENTDAWRWIILLLLSSQLVQENESLSRSQNQGTKQSESEVFDVRLGKLPESDRDGQGKHIIIIKDNRYKYKS